MAEKTPPTETVRVTETPETPTQAGRPALKVRRIDLVRIYETLGAIKGCLKDVMPRYTAASMRRRLRDAAELVSEMRDEYMAAQPQVFNREREALCKELAVKNPSGAPVIAAGNYFIDPQRQTEFDTRLAALRERHAAEIAAHEAEGVRLSKFLGEKVDMPDLPRLRLSWFTDEATQEQLEVLYDLIEADTAA